MMNENFLKLRKECREGKILAVRTAKKWQECQVEKKEDPRYHRAIEVRGDLGYINLRLECQGYQGRTLYRVFFDNPSELRRA